MLVVIYELFHGNTNSKKIIQAYNFKIFIRARLKAVYLKNGTWLQLKTFQSLISRGGVEDTRLKAKDTKKIRGQAKDSLFKDRPSQCRGQECSRPRPRTKDTAASVPKKKKRSSKKFFRQSPIYRRSQNF